MAGRAEQQRLAAAMIGWIEAAASDAGEPAAAYMVNQFLALHAGGDWAIQER